MRRKKVFLFSSLAATIATGVMLWSTIPASKEIKKAEVLVLDLKNPNPAVLGQVAERFAEAAARNERVAKKGDKLEIGGIAAINNALANAGAPR